jgi:DNA-binding GntR family transcriptional regulator
MGQTIRFPSPIEDEPSPLSSEQTKSLSDQAYEQLLDMMLAGDLTAGDILQERRLAEILKISRTPVREALSRLESDGLVTRLRGRLLTVRQFTAAEFMEALNIRKLLELEAASLAAGRLSVERARAVRQAIEDLRAMPTPTVAQHWAVDDMVHGVVAQASGNNLLVDMIGDLRRRTHMFDLRRIPTRFHASCIEHLALIDAVARGDAAEARNIVTLHIENIKLSIIDKLRKP